jgi:hypothetical protein
MISSWLARPGRVPEMTSAIDDMNAEHARRRCIAQGMPPKRILDGGNALAGREQALDVAARQHQRAGLARRAFPHGCTLSGPPIAFQAEWPPFMYFASKPASLSAMAVLQPTWKP